MCADRDLIFCQPMHVSTDASAPKASIRRISEAGTTQLRRRRRGGRGGISKTCTCLGASGSNSHLMMWMKARRSITRFQQMLWIYWCKLVWTTGSTACHRLCSAQVPEASPQTSRWTREFLSHLRQPDKRHLFRLPFQNPE